MNYLKPMAWIGFMALLYVTGAFQYVASLGQQAALQSGFVNASVKGNSKEPFDYNFTIKDLAGKKFSFKNFQGKVVFLNLWATWCGPCRSEMPAIQKLYDSVDKEKILFVMLSLDKDSQADHVNNYIKSREYTLPVYMPSGYLAEQLQVPSIPTTFVISKDGTIMLKEVGMKNYNTAKFRKYLEGLVEK
ncbi:MAG TPA: TlpA disulfide reductase family protein [Cyclobacteriaceae bacterium]|nr:TlpA disulfide reductase family protein [Cyclobacteriaceae bacterium]